MEPVILHLPAEMRAWRLAPDPRARVGFVPTMGALHEGHAELLRRMRADCDRLVLSIFVNPAQFGPKEDLARYPRTLEADFALARACGVDAIFCPTPAQMYPPGYSTYVEEERLSAPLCGATRPGHFRGVTTVVLKLFNLVRPHAAYFGLKDAQQFFVLSKMARDLDLDVEVVGVPTVREPDGLALSSRNRYLSREERERAPALRQALLEISRELLEGRPAAQALTHAREALEARGVQVQYLEVLSLPGLAPLRPDDRPSDGPALVAVAAFLGTTRLIDNEILRPELLAAHGIVVQAP